MGSNHYLNLAREGTFNEAPTSGWGGVAVTDLGTHSPIVVTQQPQTMVYGQHGPSARGRRGIVRGGTGTIKPYLQSAGLQVLFDAVFGPPAEVTELEPGLAWEYRWETSNVASAVSVSTQVARELKAGGIDRDTFTGGQVTQMMLAQAKPPMTSGVTDEGLAKLEFEVNYAGFSPSTPERLPTYPDPELVFSGADLTMWIGETLDSLEAECLDSWQLTVPAGLDIENAACMSSIVRDLAGRGAMPEPKIEASWTYKGRDYYNAWLNGQILATRARWEATGVEIAPAIVPSLQVDIAAMGMTGETATESRTESTKQNLPSDVLWNHEDPMVAVTVVCSEAPFDHDAS